MSVNNWIIYYIYDAVFWIWIFYLGGAEKIGGTFISGIFYFLITLKWWEMSAEGIKIFGWVIITAHTIVLLIGIKYPEFRAVFG